ncbi:DNA-directed DNA polymerase [Candidatus Micrarchaeota archaeon]|nr:DNA-directed DNA polymerase [Candidatus Micrarchaeota archaeon]MBU1681984.1 DNA-directed DNA polymerase [Candidatus Micrarchaeota archaeon]
MKRKRAYFIDASYIVRKNKTYVSLLLKGKKTIKLYYRADPYFLVDGPLDKIDQFLDIQAVRKNGELASPTHVEEVEKQIGLEKKSLIKIYCEVPSDVPIIKQRVPFKCYEYSIPFARRFIYDRQISPFDIITYEREGRLIKKIVKIVTPDKPPELSSMAFDIETYNPQGVPRENIDPVIMISYAGMGRGVLTTKESKNDYVKKFESEKEILEQFSKIIEEKDPDVLFGYNSANFDIPYLQARAAKLQAKLELGRFGDKTRELKRGMVKGMEIGGRVHVDLYPIARLFGFIGVIKAQKFTLNAVANEVLGKGKEDIKHDEIWQLWDSDGIDKLSKYSMIDADITHELGQRFLPLEIEVSSVSKMPLFQTTMSTSGQLVESLLMFSASNRNMIIPPRPIGDTIYERLNAPIKGAFVKLPEPGIYDNMAVLDFRGLYPSIIISYNIDPATLIEEGDGIESPTGAKFSGKEVGLIPGVLDYLVDRRSKIKQEIKKLDKSSDEYVRMSARSQALKILSNSFYGYLGYARSRWYSRPCAESVTAWGRKHISETIEMAEKSGFQVLYADTDSVFLIYKNKDKVLKFMEDVNDILPEKMELELEGFYPRGVFVSKKGGGERGAKKKYALLGEDGRIKIRGFELVRRDWSKIAKETQRAVLEAILIEGSKEKAVKIVRKTIEDLQAGKVPLEMLSISTQINKDLGSYEVKSPELTAAQKLIKSGVQVGKGTMITYVVGKTGKTISEKAEPFELAKDYDTEYYINHQVLPAVMKIMKELGYDEYSMKHGGKQQSLDSFF